MSALAGALARDGRPLDSAPVERMLDAIRHRGPDRQRVWCDGPVALAHGLLTTLPESASRGAEAQPHDAMSGQLCIVFDGRIDNREELQVAFERSRVPMSGRIDAAYALTAYRVWGDECAARLLGDFAFAIWDQPRRRLFCARDILGIKPFYYFCSPRLFLFASEREALLAHPAVSRRPNEGMVGEHLSVVTSVDETLLADIHRLPRAHQLIVTGDTCHSKTYWDLDVRREIRYRTDAEYGEHLRSLLREAVRARLRSASPAGVMLSGGVDSSSIVGLASEMHRRGTIATATDAFSMVDTGGALDESSYLDRVAALHGVRVRKFPPDAMPLTHYCERARRRGDVPPWPNDQLMNSLRLGAAAQGTRVLLNGIWGDEWFSGSFYHCADLFRSLRWGALASAIGDQARVPEVPLPGPLLKILLWPQLSRPVRRRIKRWIGRTGVPAFIRPEFARRIDLADRLYPNVLEPAFPTIAQRNIYAEMTGGLSMLTIEEHVRAGAELGVEMRYPYADRRIVEFGMAIPEELRWRHGVKKYILREAMRAYLPEETRRRPTSPDASHVFLPTLRRIADTCLRDVPAIERAGWVNGAGVRAFYDHVIDRHAAGDESYGNDIWPLWSVASVEVWMREVITNDSIGDLRKSWNTTSEPTVSRLAPIAAAHL